MSAITAADLPADTRVMTTEGRLGTVNGYDVGRVANTEHVNYGREYIGVTWDPTESIPWGQRNRPFVDELTIIEAACSVHHVEDTRQGRTAEVKVPTCTQRSTTYGVWSEGAGGFVYAADCAVEAGNHAADELRKLAKEDDTDTFEVLAVCREHEEQPATSCEDCAAA